MFAFTSMGAQIDNTINSQPEFAQLYIFDTDNEIANRLHPFNNNILNHL